MPAPLQVALRVDFPRDSAVQDAVRTWLQSEPKTFFGDWIKWRVNPFKICVEKCVVLTNDTLCVCHKLLHTK